MNRKFTLVRMDNREDIKKVAMIRNIRMLSDLGLKEAKEIADSLVDGKTGEVVLPVVDKNLINPFLEEMQLAGVKLCCNTINDHIDKAVVECINEGKREMARDLLDIIIRYK